MIKLKGTMEPDCFNLLFILTLLYIVFSILVRHNLHLVNMFSDWSP